VRARVAARMRGSKSKRAIEKERARKSESKSAPVTERVCSVSVFESVCVYLYVCVSLCVFVVCARVCMYVCVYAKHFQSEQIQLTSIMHVCIMCTS